jgi:TPR repeat protein
MVVLVALNRCLSWLLAGIVTTLYATGVAAVTAQEGPMIMRLAERGSAGAQVLLAGMYLRGEGGVARDDRKAAEWLEKAAVQGNVYAEMKLGDLYAKGQGVPKNLEVAADWREKAANRGSVRAQKLLGKMYLDGEGVAKDPGKAEYWLNRAALEGGDAEAQYLLAHMHLKGDAAAPNPDLASHLLGRAAAQGHEAAAEMLHLVEELGYSLEESLHQRPPHLHKLAQDGDEEAQYQLGLRLENSLFATEADRREAVTWFERAAAGGNVMAMKSLAHIYEKGLDGVPADPDKARYWKQKAEQQTKP